MNETQLQSLKDYLTDKCYEKKYTRWELLCFAYGATDADSIPKEIITFISKELYHNRGMAKS